MLKVHSHTATHRKMAPSCSHFFAGVTKLQAIFKAYKFLKYSFASNGHAVRTATSIFYVETKF